jgi:ATP-dependent protease ClpP protease subunit
MATAFIYFGKPTSPDTVTSLMMACRTFISEIDPANGLPRWDHLHLEIVSGGGDVISSFGAYNELVGLPTKLTTHNAGACDSAALMLFMAGVRRTASSASAFFFHQLQWSFASQAGLTATVIKDATKWLGTYETLMAETIAARTGMSAEQTLDLIREGTSVKPDEAKTLGLIHEIEECAIPYGARSWQV